MRISTYELNELFWKLCLRQKAVRSSILARGESLVYSRDDYKAIDNLMIHRNQRDRSYYREALKIKKAAKVRFKKEQKFKNSNIIQFFGFSKSAKLELRRRIANEI